MHCSSWATVKLFLWSHPFICLPPPVGRYWPDLIELSVNTAPLQSCIIIIINMFSPGDEKAERWHIKWISNFRIKDVNDRNKQLKWMFSRNLRFLHAFSNSRIHQPIKDILISSSLEPSTNYHHILKEQTFFVCNYNRSGVLYEYFQTNGISVYVSFKLPKMLAVVKLLESSFITLTASHTSYIIKYFTGEFYKSYLLCWLFCSVVFETI